MNIYICDDSIQEANVVKKEVKNFSLFSDNEVNIKEIFTNPEELLTDFQKNNEGTNIFILDINYNIQDLNGLILAQRIKEIDPNAFIIFVTSHAEFSFLTFEYRIGAIDYIIKDIQKNWAREIFDCLKTIENRLIKLSERNENIIVLETSIDIKRLPIREILFFESSKTNKLSVTTFNSQYTVNKKNLKTLEEELSPQFWRCHRSYLINTKHIVATDKNKSHVILKNNFSIPVSGRKKASLKEKLL